MMDVATAALAATAETDVVSDSEVIDAVNHGDLDAAQTDLLGTPSVAWGDWEGTGAEVGEGAVGGSPIPSRPATVMVPQHVTGAHEK